MKKETVEYFCDKCQSNMPKPKDRNFEVNVKMNGKVFKKLTVTDLCDTCKQELLNAYMDLAIKLGVTKEILARELS